MNNLRKIIYLTTYLDDKMSQEYGVTFSEAGLKKKNQMVKVLEKNFDLKLVFTSSFTRFPGQVFESKIIRISKLTDLFFPKVLTVPIINYMVNPIFSFLMVRKLIKNEKSQVIILIYNLTYENILPALLLKLSSKVIILAQYEDGVNPNFGWFKKIIGRISEKIGIYISTCFIVNSRVFSNKFPEKEYFIFRGICDELQEQESEVRTVEVKPKGQITILFSSTLDEIRGINLLNSLFRNTTSQKLIKNVHFLVCGQGSNNKKQELISSIEDYRLKGGKAEYKGFVSREELHDLSNGTDVFLSLQDPSLDFSKNSFPSKIFDYMAYNRPVISTKVSDLEHDALFKNLMFIASDWESLQEKILAVMDSIEHYFDDNAKNFTLLNQNFSLDQVASDLSAFIGDKMFNKTGKL